VPIAVLLELLHAATLVHDDVVDESPVRRGEETPFLKWGSKISVLMGDYLFARVLSMGVSSRWPEVLHVISEMVMKMADCELRQAFGVFDPIPTDKGYYEIIEGKTAGFFSAACHLAGIVVKEDRNEMEKLRRLGYHFGMAFQIRDDILDLEGAQNRMGKPEFQDLDNGKITLPLILALEGARQEEKDRLLRLMGSDRREEHDKILAFIHEKKGLEKAQEKAVTFTGEAQALLDTFPGSEYRKSMERLLHYHLERTE
jgi:octaprenyl-diphosphate synthase